MIRVKKHKFMCIGITLLGVILLGMPALYAQDEPAVPEWVGSATETVDSNATVEEGLEALGDTYEDLVYTPVTPCKIVDTRYGGGGFFSAGQTRTYYVHGNCASQGGTTCNSPVGEPTAVHISMAAVTPNGQGNIKAFPKGADGSSGLTVNFAPIGTNLNNAGTVKTAYNAGTDIGVKASYAGSHVTIQVLGYYSRPERTKPDFYRAAGTASIANNSYGYVYSSYCPSGYEWVSPGTNFYLDQAVYLIGLGRSGTAQRSICYFRNISGSAKTMTCYAHCIRIPGR